MSDEPPQEFHLSTETVVATLLELFRAQGNRIACDVLENAKARIEETGYDNWDGGTFMFTLFLELPMKVFAHVESDVQKMEKLIAGKFAKVLPADGNQWLQEVAIRPVLEDPAKTLTPKVTPADVEHLWTPGMLRLFLSHVSKHKVAVSKLKRELRKYGVSSFVAHEDIEPSLEWQSEIELALRSMHALVALLTPEFHESKWTDQEVGIALGKGTLVIAVTLGLDPYGFIGKVQGLPGSLDDPASLASSIVDLLLKHKGTIDKMQEALIVGLEKASSFDAAKVVTKKISGLRHISTAQLDRMQAAVKSNGQVSGCYGAPERIQQIVQRFKPPVAKDEDVPF
ncbi:MAG TPA: toll/interleukin-1 receptor domain-containing protein [Candidatus Sulfotelmatobacter sp.]|nr:toll/interleukin-1 receptor domain-containing protein [Candidatus Sulfotelmatobacter sp.]